jgi:hypothetical protein
MITNNKSTQAYCDNEEWLQQQHQRQKWDEKKNEQQLIVYGWNITCIYHLSTLLCKSRLLQNKKLDLNVEKI